MTPFVAFMFWLGMCWLIYECGRPATEAERLEELGTVSRYHAAQHEDAP